MNHLTENQLKALDLQRNIALTAGAGSGKTTVLVNRYLHILFSQPELSVSRILAITFTEKAAAEMKERIFREVEQRFRQNQKFRNRLFAILQELHQAQIFTIHAFCNNLLKQYPVEAGIQPDFLILEDVQQAEFFQRTFRDFFQQYGSDPEEPLRLQQLALSAFTLREIKRFLQIIYDQRAILLPFLKQTARLTPEEILEQWKEHYVRFHRDALREFLQDRTLLNTLQQLSASHPHDVLSEQVERLLDSSTSEQEQIQIISMLLRRLLTSQGTAYRRVNKNTWNGPDKELFREASRLAEKYGQRFWYWDAETNRRYPEIIAGLSRIAHDFLQFADIARARMNALDFDELQIRAIQLLEHHPEIRERLHQRFRHVLVDEFQDTDVLQSRLIELLTKREDEPIPPGKLFFVGDAKQSIYGFRHADLRIFQEFTRRIRQTATPRPFHHPETGEALPASPEEESGIINLQQNFRSDPALIAFFNHFFETLFTASGEFEVPFQKLIPARTALPGLNSQAHLHILISDQTDTLTKSEIISREADYVAQLIHRIVEQNPLRRQVISGSSESTRPIQYGDVAILLRGRTHLEALITALRQHRIPHQTYKGKGFFRQQEVQDLYYLLRWLAQPEDDFALLTFLRSEFAGLTDNTLFHLSQVEGATYWERFRKLVAFREGQLSARETFRNDFTQFLEKTGQMAEIPPDQQHAMAYLNRCFREWQPLAQTSRFTQLLDTVMESLHIRALLAAQKDGSQKLANIDKFVRFVQEYQLSRSALLMDLLEALENQIRGEGHEGEATILEQEENKVQILTYHSAKGMEFPVVILPFLNQRFMLNSRQTVFTDQLHGFSMVPGSLKNRKVEQQGERTEQQEPFIHQWLKQREEAKKLAEEKRLLYVAATRARDHLWMIGAVNSYGKVETPSYLKWLCERYALEPLPAESQQRTIPLTEHHQLQVQFIPFSAVTTREPAEESVNEPLEEPFSLPEFHPEYHEVVPEPPGGQVYSATQLMIFQENPDRYFHHFYLQDYRILPPAVEFDYQDEPGGALWGSAVHKLLEDFPARPAEQDARKIEWIIRRYFPEPAAQPEEIRKRLHELMVRLRKSELVTLLSAPEQFSEFSADLRMGPFILQGIFDRLFRNREGLWEVLDFKTNRISPARVAETARKYRFQVEAYALLLSRLYPEQKRFPVTLFFLEPMESVRTEFTPIELQGIHRNVLELMQELYRRERELFSPHSPTPFPLE